MVKIGNKEFDIKLLITDKAKRQGLKFVKESSMPKSSGVALIFEQARLVPITMKDVTFALDLVYVLKDTVVGIKTLEVGAKDVTFPKKVTAVIELHKGASKGIKVGDRLIGKIEKFEVKDGDVEVEKGKLHILDENGETQMNISGQERIISRVHTKQLHNAAKKAHKSKKDKDYRVVGRAIIRIVNKQNTQTQLYTK